jgi:hypothetical protein
MRLWILRCAQNDNMIFAASGGKNPGLLFRLLAKYFGP